MSAGRWRPAAAGLLLAAGIACGLRAVWIAEAGAGADSLYQLCYEQPQQASALLLETLEEDGRHYALFRQTMRTVEAPLLLRRSRAVHVEYAGSAALLFLPDRLRSGSFPTDSRGCVVDLATARSLWGSDAPLGMELECDGRVYDVTGVVAASQPLLLTCAATPFAYTAALFRPGLDDGFAQQAVQEFEQALSAQNPLRRDAARLPTWMRLAARLPFWCMFVAVLTRFLRHVPLGRAARRVTVLPAAILGGWMLRLPNPITPDMLPTRWADFSFWQRRLETAVGEWCTSWFLPGTLSELLLLREVVLPALGWTVAACACMVLAGAVGGQRLGKAAQAAPVCPR